MLATVQGRRYRVTSSTVRTGRRWCLLGSGEFLNNGRHFRLDILSKGVEALTIRRGGLLLLRGCEDRRRIRPCESKSELPVRSILRRLTPSAGSILLIVVVGIDTHDLVPSLTMHRNEGNSWMIMERVTTVRVRMSGCGQTETSARRFWMSGLPPVCTENPIRVDDVMESPKLAE